MKSQKWKGNTGGGLLGQRSLIAFFRFLDIRIGYFILRLVIPFYMLFSRKGYKAMFYFFRKRFNCSIWQSFAKTYKNHFVFGQVILDRFAVFAGRKDLFEIEIIGNEQFSRLANGDKGFIIASSHVGNFEIGGYFLRSEKKKINALVYSGETKTVQENRNKLLRSNNINPLPVLDDMSHLFAINAALQNGEIVSAPCDRNLGSAKSLKCNFLNGKACFPIGSFVLAATFDVDVVAIFVMKESTRKYTVYVKPIAINESPNVKITKQQKIESLARLYVEELENIVKKYPEQWFNYFEFWDKNEN